MKQIIGIILLLAIGWLGFTIIRQPEPLDLFKIGLDFLSSIKNQTPTVVAVILYLAILALATASVFALLEWDYTSADEGLPAIIGIIFVAITGLVVTGFNLYDDTILFPYSIWYNTIPLGILAFLIIIYTFSQEHSLFSMLALIVGYAAGWLGGIMICFILAGIIYIILGILGFGILLAIIVAMLGGR